MLEEAGAQCVLITDRCHEPGSGDKLYHTWREDDRIDLSFAWNSGGGRRRCAGRLRGTPRAVHGGLSRLDDDQSVANGLLPRLLSEAPHRIRLPPRRRLGWFLVEARASHLP